MRRYILILFLITSTTMGSSAQDSMEEIEQSLQKRIREVTKEIYNGKPEAHASLHAEDGILTLDDNRAQGRETIRQILSRFSIPPTEYEIIFTPIEKIDSTYVMRYLIKESTGNSLQQIELWNNYDGELMISYSNSILIPDPGQSGGISQQRFILSTIILGVFLFVLLLIYKNARKWKTKKS